MTATEVRLAGGRLVIVRPAGPADVAAIVRLYQELSRESCYRRFFTAQPRPALAARWAGLDRVPGTRCFVAADPAEPGRLAAEARYVPIGGGAAELALTVSDDYQGAGLGRLLLDALVAQACADGMQRLRAIVLLVNTPMLRLLQRYGWVLAGPTEDYSVACLEISATGGMPGWAGRGGGRRVLVERQGWFDDERVAALRSAGDEGRQCPGPSRHAGRSCPLVTSGRCALAEEADIIVSMLPPGDPECAAVLAAHGRRWPGRVAAG